MKVPKREEIANEYKWNLDSLFKSDNEWERCFDELQNNLESILEFKGILKNRDVLKCALTKRSEQGLIMSNLYVYANMKKHEDATVDIYQSMCDRIEMLSVKMSEMTSYISSEINESYSAEELYALSKEADFYDYSYSLEEIARCKAIIKSEKEESIISQVGSFSDTFQNIFAYFDNSDIEFDPIIGEDGKRQEMSHGRYSLFMQSENRTVRKRAFISMFSPYKHYINTIATIYGGNLKQDKFYANMRGFDSCMDYSMYMENVDSVVYTNLIESVHLAIPALTKYLDYRKKVLGVKNLYCYDLYVPIVKGAGYKKEYEEAYSMVLEALAPLGSEYNSLLKMAKDNRWIDVYENKNKRSGAYSWGTYSSNPYVLLNYTKTTHDIFTIAHELGHSLHSYYSHQNQPLPKASYEIFVAEVASTVNEVLLLKHLLKTTVDTETKKYLLSYYLEMFRTTVFRQTMFAEFELIAHQIIENGGAATAQNLCDEYFKLNELYYPSVKLDKLISYEWARIPHFYNSFYVYKYATGLTSAVYIAEKIIEGDSSVIEGYKKFLSAGGSMPPCDILKLAGVDLTGKEAFEYSFNRFNEAVSELCEL